MSVEQARAAALRQAATAKRQAATGRAETGLRRLIKTGQPVTFRAVAAAGEVSVDFLYRHPELRPRIERLRGQQEHRPDRADAANETIAGTNANVVRTLTARLTETRRELAAVKQQLAVAQGELLTLRRQPGGGPAEPPSSD